MAKPGAAGQLLWGGQEPAALGPGPRWPSRQGRVPVSTGTVARGAHDRSQRGGRGGQPTNHFVDLTLLAETNSPAVKIATPVRCVCPAARDRDGTLGFLANAYPPAFRKQDS